MNNGLINTEIRAKLNSSLPYKKYSIIQIQIRDVCLVQLKTDNTDGKVENGLIRGAVVELGVACDLIS